LEGFGNSNRIDGWRCRSTIRWKWTIRTEL